MQSYAHIENIVLKGGGTRGVGYLTALEEASKHGLNLDDPSKEPYVKRVGGASAGSIMALCLALGIPLSELKKEMVEKKLDEFLDDQPLYRRWTTGPLFRTLIALSERKNAISISDLGYFIASGIADAFIHDREMNDSLKQATLSTALIFVAEWLYTITDKVIRLPAFITKETENKILAEVEKISEEFERERLDNIPIAAGGINEFKPAIGVFFKELLNGKFEIFSGNRFLEWIEKKIATAIGLENGRITFAELKQLEEKLKKNKVAIKDLYVVALDLGAGITKVFSYETTPDVIIADAVRASMSIPLLFARPKVMVKTSENKEIFYQEDSIDGKYTPFYIDGGALDNLPLWLFKGDPAKTLAFALETKKTIDLFTKGLKALPKPTVTYNTPDDKKNQNFNTSYIYQTFTAIAGKQNNDHYVSGDSSRTVYIDTQDISFVNFNLTKAQKEILLNAGKQGVINHLERLQSHTLIARTPTTSQKNILQSPVVHLPSSDINKSFTQSLLKDGTPIRVMCRRLHFSDNPSVRAFEETTQIFSAKTNEKLFSFATLPDRCAGVDFCFMPNGRLVILHSSTHLKKNYLNTFDLEAKNPAQEAREIKLADNHAIDSGSNFDTEERHNHFYLTWPRGRLLALNDTLVAFPGFYSPSQKRFAAREMRFYIYIVNVLTGNVEKILNSDGIFSRKLCLLPNQKQIIQARVDNERARRDVDYWNAEFPTLDLAYKITHLDILDLAGKTSMKSYSVSHMNWYSLDHLQALSDTTIAFCCAHSFINKNKPGLGFKDWHFKIWSLTENKEIFSYPIKPSSDNYNLCFGVKHINLKNQGDTLNGFEIYERDTLTAIIDFPIATKETKEIKSVKKNEEVKKSSIVPSHFATMFKQVRHTEHQRGWNCFDVAIGLPEWLNITEHHPDIRAGAAREKLVKFALKNAEDDAYRHLLAPEIWSAVILMALPKTMQTDEVKALSSEYDEAHRALDRVIQRLNNSLGRVGGQSRNRLHLEKYFLDDAHHRELPEYKEFKEQIERVDKANQALTDYCHEQKTYEDYLNHYYYPQFANGKITGGWFVFQPEMGSSMVDMAACYMQSKIVIYDNQENILYTADYGNHTIPILFTGDHFIALERDIQPQYERKAP